MQTYLSYWRNSRIGPKKGILVFLDGQLEFDLSDTDSYKAALKRQDDAIGEVYFPVVNYPRPMTVVGCCGEWRVVGKPCADVNDAILSFREEYQKKSEYCERMKNDSEFALAERLKKHDWTFEYSDDHRGWSEGNRSKEEIQRVMSTLPTEMARQIWEANAPKGYPFNSFV